MLWRHKTYFCCAETSDLDYSIWATPVAKIQRKRAFVCIRMLPLCYSYASVCYLYVSVCYPFISHMYSYVPVCIRGFLVCYPYVLVGVLVKILLKRQFFLVILPWFKINQTSPRDIGCGLCVRIKFHQWSHIFHSDFFPSNGKTPWI